MGRPARPQEQTRAVLTAPLEMSSPRWGSRALAHHTGTTQSTVARIWAQTYTDPAWRTVRLPSYDARIAAVIASPDTMVVVLTGRPTTGDPALTTTYMRSSRRPALQTLLAADLLRETMIESDTAASEPEAALLVADVSRQQPRGRITVALTRAPLAEVADDQQLVVDDPDDWQRLLGHLVHATARSTPGELTALQFRLLDWARGRRAALLWRPEESAPALRPEPSPPLPGDPRPLSQEIAREAFRVILARVASGQLGAGDRITESSLARSLRTSRTYVREALRTLAADGLVDLEPRRGAVVPLPRVRDVIDTYSARRALGGLLVQRAATSPTRDLEPADRALQEMLAIAETGDARATGDADVRFQDALAGATAMRHVPGMFQTLSDQVLLYTTVMGMAYVYSIPHMCRDDVAILKAVQARDEARALALWQAKIDAALDHMARHL